MKILFACGGTGGHINPAIAIASTIKAKQPDVQILFAGNPKGMEAKLVPQAGFDFAPIIIKGFQRPGLISNTIFLRFSTSLRLRHDQKN